MKVKLVGYTQPAEDFKQSFSDTKELIAYCARVSNPSNQLNNETADKLLAYLIKHKHWSPFEMASVTLEIETTRDIARQMLRHKTMAFQEMSQRYCDPTKEVEFVIREARLQDTKNRQNSTELDMQNPEHRELQRLWQEKQQEVIQLAAKNYEWAVSNGLAKEQARVVLPEGNMTSRLYVHGTIRSFIHYIEVRTDPSTQKEHRELALAVAEAVSKVFDYKRI
jgi:thymidylate synthase (FAD)